MGLNSYRHSKAIDLSADTQQQYQKRIEGAIANVKDFTNEANVSGWELIAENPVQAAKLYKQTNESTPTYKLSGELYNTTVDKVFQLLWDLSNAIKLSGSLEECDLLSEFDGIQLIYHGHKSAGFMISARDFLILRTAVTEGETKLIVNKSTIHPKVPDRSKFVRGELHFSGYVLKPSATKPNTVEISYTIRSDPKGMLPQWVINLANKTLIDKFVELQSHLN